MKKPTIVIPAYNRPAALQRLLDSLLRADYPADVQLIIVIDGGGEWETAVSDTATNMDWPFGEKKVIMHKKKRGLIGNVFFCAALSLEYEAVILLEDDLFVAPQFYDFAQQALAFYEGDDRVAGISLNGLAFNGYTQQPFEPLLDGADTFFMQVSWYQGQVYTAAMWRNFEAWQLSPTQTQPLHEVFDNFATTDWFPHVMRYLVETGRYYLFPRASLTTNFGEIGTHFDRRTRLFQLPLLQGKRPFYFLPFDQATAVYDAFQELQPERLLRFIDLPQQDISLDLYGTRSQANTRTPYVLTTRPSRHPLYTWGLEMRPLEANLIENVAGDEIVLSRVADVEYSRLGTWRQQARLHRYFERRPLSRRLRLRHWFVNRFL